MDHSDGVLKSELLQLLERINIHSYLKSLIILNFEAYIAIHFYPRDAMLARVIAIATCLSVRLSVRHAPVLCQNEES